ncbi:MAG: T9SS type A sorting domain-containing protein [Bacteroidia bacterium]
MKNLLLLSIFMLSLASYGLAQCDPNGISTDPDNPVNPDQPEKTNTFFDWQAKDYDMYQTINGDGKATSIPAPFNQIDNINVDPIYGADFRPEDGWELLAQNLGYEDDGSIRTDLTNPYVILYNKYTGKLRVFLAVGDKDQDYQAAELLLMLADEGGKNRAVMGHADALMEPVQTFDPGNQMAAVQMFINEDNKWLTAEYQMAYDPCVCNEGNKKVFIQANLIDSARITLNGSINGTITPIEVKNKKVTSSGVTLKGASAFFKKTGSKINSVGKVYKDTKAFWKSIKSIADSSGTRPQSEKDQMKAALDAITGRLEKEQPTKVDPRYTSSSSSGNSGSAGGNGTAGKIISLGLKAVPFIGDALGVLNSLIGGGSAPSAGPQKVVFGPLATESKLTASGYIASSRTFKTITFDMPGSSNLEPDGQYPYYNEALGIMNVIQRPQITHRIYNDLVLPPGVDDDNLSGVNFIEVDRVHQLELSEDLLYAINPALGIDEEESDMLAALFVEVEYGPVVETKGAIKVGDRLYRTPFLPLSCLNGYIMELHKGSTSLNYHLDPQMSFSNVFVQIAASLERSDNPDASSIIYSARYKTDTHTSESIGTDYWENIVTTPKTNPLAIIEGENIRLENRQLAAGEIIYATQSITIGPNVTVVGGGRAELIAGDEVIIEDGIDLDEHIDIKTGYPTPCQAIVPQATPDQIQAMCSSDSYQERANKRLESEQSTEVQPGLTPKANSPFELYPNPTQTEFTVSFSVETSATISLEVFDMVGRQVLKPISEENHPAGSHTKMVDLQDLQVGVYNVQLSIDGKKHSMKLVKQ